MMLHRRILIRRAALKAKAVAGEVVATVEKDARAIAEAARADFLAGFQRFNEALKALEAQGEGGAAEVLKGIDVPLEHIDQALERAGVDLEAEAAKARAAEGADLHPG